MQSDETLASELHCEDVRGDEQILTDFEFSTLGPPVCMSLTDLIAAIPIIIDADHDLDVPRKCNAISNPFEASDEDELQQDPMVNSWASFQLGHRSRSTLDRVGLQVWRGALLLCDAVCVLDCMKGSVVIEMGSGTGLTALACALAGVHTIFATDLPDPIVLENLRTNVQSAPNLALIRQMRSDWVLGSSCSNSSLPASIPSIHVRALDVHRPPDFFRQRAATQGPADPAPTSAFSWTDADLALVHSGAPVVFLAADVVYDEALTESLVCFLSYHLQRLPGSVAMLSIEKRYNFTLRDEDERAPAWDHFIHVLSANGFAVDPALLCAVGDSLAMGGGERLKTGSGPGSAAPSATPSARVLRASRISVAQIPPRFVYDRGRDMELIVLSSTVTTT